MTRHTDCHTGSSLTSDMRRRRKTLTYLLTHYTSTSRTAEVHSVRAVLSAVIYLYSECSVSAAESRLTDADEDDEDDDDSENELSFYRNKETEQQRLQNSPQVHITKI